MDFINNLLKPNNAQWEMSSADNEFGMSLPISQVDNMSVLPQSSPIPSAPLAVEDTTQQNIQDAINALYNFKPATADDITSAMDKLMKQSPQYLASAQVGAFTGAVMKTIGQAGDFFSRATGLAMGQLGNIDKQAEIAGQSYQNQMEALDNQVLYIKNQLSDRFNKTVESNIMQMAAKNIRVTSGGVLDLTKDLATEVTEDMRTAESNARLKQIALQAAQKSTKASAKYAKFNAINSFINSAAKLGMTMASGGGTGQTWGNLWSGYNDGKEALKLADTIKEQEFNKLYS